MPALKYAILQHCHLDNATMCRSIDVNVAPKCRILQLTQIVNVARQYVAGNDTLSRSGFGLDVTHPPVTAPSHPPPSSTLGTTLACVTLWHETCFTSKLRASVKVALAWVMLGGGVAPQGWGDVNSLPPASVNSINTLTWVKFVQGSHLGSKGKPQTQVNHPIITWVIGRIDRVRVNHKKS